MVCQRECENCSETDDVNFRMEADCFLCQLCYDTMVDDGEIVPYVDEDYLYERWRDDKLIGD